MNDALHELGRPNEAGRSRKSTRSLFQLRRSTATAISAYHSALQLWPIFYAADNIVTRDLRRQTDSKVN
jgi:hypothetical protein